MCSTTCGRGFTCDDRKASSTLVARLGSLCLAFAACLAGPAEAADEAIDRIAKTGRIVIGAQDTAWPVNYLGPEGKHIGYHIDICQRVVERVRQHLNLPEIRIATVPATMATRMALLANGTVDMDCGPNPINNASMRAALFAHATIADSTGFMTTVDKPRYGIGDLEHKSIGLVTGAPTVPMLRASLRRQNFVITEIFGRSVRDTFAMLEDGRVDLIGGPVPSLMSKRALSTEPARYVLLDFNVGRIYAGIMVGLGDEKLRALANEVIDSLARTGELARLYERWFSNGINPGFTLPIQVPISTIQKEIFADPGSEMENL